MSPGANTFAIYSFAAGCCWHRSGAEILKTFERLRQPPLGNPFHMGFCCVGWSWIGTTRQPSPAFTLLHLRASAWDSHFFKHFLSELKEQLGLRSTKTNGLRLTLAAARRSG